MLSMHQEEAEVWGEEVNTWVKRLTRKRKGEMVKGYNKQKTRIRRITQYFSRHCQEKRKCFVNGQGLINDLDNCME